MRATETLRDKAMEAWGSLERSILSPGEPKKLFRAVDVKLGTDKGVSQAGV